MGGLFCRFAQERTQNKQFSCSPLCALPRFADGVRLRIVRGQNGDDTPNLYRFLNPQGEFQLTAALYEGCADRIGTPGFKRALDFLDEVAEITPIRKIESAALTYCTAVDMAKNTRD